MTLDELEGDKCAFCASPFEAKQAKQIYCSPECRSAARYEEHEGWRARRREDLVCVRCSSPIVGAERQDRKLCDDCQKLAASEANEKCRRKRRAAKRERTLSTMTCISCSTPIVGAEVTWRTLCDDCRLLRRAETLRRYKAKARASISRPPGAAREGR